MHGRPRLSVYGRGLLVRRVLEEGWRPAQAAEALGVSRATAYEWLRRFAAEGWSGLKDRSCRPRRSPTAVSTAVEARLLALRRADKLGPHRLADRTGVPRSTCYAVLRRHGLHRLDWMDRPTGAVVRRYERARPGELLHVDVKKLGRIPDGGGHRVLGRANRPRWGKAGVGYAFVHACVDDHSRMAYAEVLDDEKAATCAAFLRRAGAFFAAHGVQVERVLTDNGPGYRSHLFRRAVADLGAVPRLTRPYRPQTNGKVERFNRTLLEEWAYVRPYASDQERTGLLPDWLHRYNHHRPHSALGGRSPAERVNNLPGNYS
jgi:transposase InsO family protein